MEVDRVKEFYSSCNMRKMKDLMYVYSFWSRCFGLPQESIDMNKVKRVYLRSQLKYHPDKQIGRKERGLGYIDEEDAEKVSKAINFFTVS